MEPSFKEQCKDFWKENKDKIKIGLKCLGVGLVIGFFKGVSTALKLNHEETMKLLDKVPDGEKIKDNDEALYYALKDQSKEKVNDLMNEMEAYGDMRP